MVSRPHEDQLRGRPVPVEAFPLELVPADYRSVLRQLHPVVDAPALEPVRLSLAEVLDELYAVPAVAFPVLLLLVAHFFSYRYRTRPIAPTFLVTPEKTEFWRKKRMS